VGKQVVWLTQSTGKSVSPSGHDLKGIFATLQCTLQVSCRSIIDLIRDALASSIVSILLYQLLPLEWWSLGLAVGLSITIMAVLRITHPPASADPLVLFMAGFGWEFMNFPVMTGSALPPYLCGHFINCHRTLNTQL